MLTRRNCDDCGTGWRNPLHLTISGLRTKNLWSKLRRSSPGHKSLVEDKRYTHAEIITCLILCGSASGLLGRLSQSSFDYGEGRFHREPEHSSPDGSRGHGSHRLLPEPEEVLHLSDSVRWPTHLELLLLHPTWYAWRNYRTTDLSFSRAGVLTEGPQSQI